MGDDVDRDDGLEELESAVLDALEVAEDRDVPVGTESLWAARRRRAVGNVAWLLGEGPVPPAG